eukprot:scaffold82146_cov31-Tisochrysis_lutea.AAC.1
MEQNRSKSTAEAAPASGRSVVLAAPKLYRAVLFPTHRNSYILEWSPIPNPVLGSRECPSKLIHAHTKAAWHSSDHGCLKGQVPA